jgi:tRNA-specific 2-thiouridylase
VDGELVVTFVDRPRGVAPGQTVVLYDDDRVVGSATINSTR